MWWVALKFQAWLKKIRTKPKSKPKLAVSTDRDLPHELVQNIFDMACIGPNLRLVCKEVASKTQLEAFRCGVCHKLRLFMEAAGDCKPKLEVKTASTGEFSNWDVTLVFKDFAPDALNAIVQSIAGDNKRVSIDFNFMTT